MGKHHTPGDPTEWGVWDSEWLIHFDLELFIWLEVVNGQITTLRWYLSLCYVSCEEKKPKQQKKHKKWEAQQWSEFICRSGFLFAKLSEFTSFPQSLLASFTHSFKYIFPHNAKGLGEDGECFPHGGYCHSLPILFPYHHQSQNFSDWETCPFSSYESLGQKSNFQTLAGFRARLVYSSWLPEGGQQKQWGVYVREGVLDMIDLKFYLSQDLLP